MTQKLHFVLPAVALLAAGGLRAQETSPKEAKLPESRPASAARYTKLGDLDGVKSVTKFSDRLIRGAQPQGAEGMESLKKLGVKTILSVEEPDQVELDAAAKAGIAIINVPTLYTGLPPATIKDLVEKSRNLEGTAYAHCHHGKHRGGAAVAILRMTYEGVPQLEAVQELAELGCSKRYPGLYDTVRNYRPDPTTAHRVPKPRPGIDGLIEVTPWLFRGTSALGADALASLKELGITSIVSADMNADAKARVMAAGFAVSVVHVDVEKLSAEDRQAVVSSMGPMKDTKVFLHSTHDPAKVAAMVAAFRIAKGHWTSEEAAREIEALVPGEQGSKAARTVRGIP
jgi:protein tyrosine phosphatase (PTP) superfamily phosphohydrolase (DUF442 family)